jgi:uncharacterized protein with von Willebrand factor type A (vWA) domain
MRVAREMSKAGDTIEAQVVRFADRLRQEGLSVPAQAVADFLAAIELLGPGDPLSVGWSGFALFVHGPDEIETYWRIFAEFFGGVGEVSKPQVVSQRVALDDEGSAEDGDEEVTVDRVVRYSRSERLQDQDISLLSEADRKEALRLVEELDWMIPKRLRMRYQPAKSGAIDLGATVAKSIACYGEPVETGFRDRERRKRKLVFLIDVSGSMAGYSEAYLRLAWGARRVNPSTEAFTIGTRTTRITRALASEDPQTAVAGALALATDRGAGTRLGNGIHSFAVDAVAKSAARGAIVMIFSDGWDRGDPKLIAHAMARLNALSRRVVWVNPLAERPGYEPLTRGMMAALPHIDRFVPGASVRTLSQLARLVMFEGGEHAGSIGTSPSLAKTG